MMSFVTQAISDADILIFMTDIYNDLGFEYKGDGKSIKNIDKMVEKPYFFLSLVFLDHHHL